jgi:hypothetical protein
MAIAFARANSLSLMEVLQWHPRDMDTWAALNQAEAQDRRFEQMHQQQ